MPRLLTPAMIAALSASVLRPALLVSMQFATSTVYVWSGYGPIIWSGMTFQGVGDLGSISTISEGSTVEAQNVTIELSGIPSDMMTEVLNETRILGTVNIWLALFDSNGVLIPDPFMSYQGKMDQPSIEDSGETCSCSITVENVLVDLNRPVYRRYTNDDFQTDHPGDTIYIFVPGVQERITFWGTSPSSSNNV